MRSRRIPSNRAFSTSFLLPPTLALMCVKPFIPSILPQKSPCPVLLCLSLFDLLLVLQSPFFLNQYRIHACYLISPTLPPYFRPILCPPHPVLRNRGARARPQTSFPEHLSPLLARVVQGSSSPLSELAEEALGVMKSLVPQLASELTTSQVAAKIR